MENNKEIEQAIKISQSIDGADTFKTEIRDWVWNELEMLYNTKTFTQEDNDLVKAVIEFTMVGLARVGLNDALSKESVGK